MYASRISRLTGSVAREILSHANNKDMLSFAGGLPANEAFKGLKLPDDEGSSFQYGASEGERSLRELFAERFQAKGIDCGFEQVLITSGAQQGVDLVSKLFIEPGVTVGIEKPTYLAAIQSFALFGAEFEPFGLEADGPNLEEFEQVLQKGDFRFIYLCPSFQNPSGICYSLEKRKAVAALLDEYEVTLIEDDPYGELNYTDACTVPICSFLKKAKWIHFNTVSKILAPGLRLGCLGCSPEFFPHLLKLKQAADLHSNRFSQAVVHQWLSDEDLMAKRTQQLRSLYHEKQQVMAQSLETHFKDLAEWNTPAGGLFFWLRLKEPVQIRELLGCCLKQGVAFMPGGPFFPTEDEGAQFMRLNFSNPPVERIDGGLKVLAEEIGKMVTLVV
jgi:DNA-binding transcriptional MocR family regulator